MYAFATPSPPPSSAAPAGAGQVSLRGLGQPWVVGAGWNNHAHMTATCSGSAISRPRTMAWQTPGVGEESPLCQGEGEKVHLQSPKRSGKKRWPHMLWAPSSSQRGPQRTKFLYLPLPTGTFTWNSFSLKLSTCAPEGHWQGNHNTRVKENGDGKGALKSNFKCFINEAFLYWFVYDCYCPCNWISKSCWLWFGLDCENINWTNNKSRFHKYHAFLFACNNIWNKKTCSLITGWWWLSIWSQGPY